MTKMKPWDYVKLRDMTEGLSVEARGKILHESYRRFILREASQ